MPYSLLFAFISAKKKLVAMQACFQGLRACAANWRGPCSKRACIAAAAAQPQITEVLVWGIVEVMSLIKQAVQVAVGEGEGENRQLLDSLYGDPESHYTGAQVPSPGDKRSMYGQ